MRVYVPSTLPDLAEVLRTGQVPPGRAYAVTPALREAYASGDQEELEYAAMTAAARASLRLLAAAPGAPPRRVVLAAEVAPAASSPNGIGDDPAAIVLSQPVPVADLVAAHVDDEAACADVRAAAAALPAADAGDPDAEFTVDGAEGHELAWYATQELSALVQGLP